MRSIGKTRLSLRENLSITLPFMLDVPIICLKNIKRFFLFLKGDTNYGCVIKRHTSVIFRETQLKTTVKCHLPPVKVDTVGKTGGNAWQKNVEKKSLAH